ncbi:hypothetical protein DRP43_00725, partial [candidate division TA06 bacterium]
RFASRAGKETCLEYLEENLGKVKKNNQKYFQYMTGKEIIAMFKSLVDDSSIDNDLALNLGNTAKDEIEEERNWRMLLVKNTENTFGPSNDYTTEISLPDNFNIEHKVALVDSNGNEDEYDPIPFEDLVKNKDVDYYSIDYANKKMYISGSVSETKTIHLYYFKFTDDIALDDEPEWPERFHKIIPYRMAEIWLSGIDADTLTRLQFPTHQAVAKRLYSLMQKWDSRLWSKAMGDRAGFKERNRAYRTNIIQELSND